MLKENVLNTDDAHDFSEEAAIVEAILLLEVEPVSEMSIAKFTGLSERVVSEALELLAAHSKAEWHGIEPVRVGGGWTLSPKVRLWHVLKRRYGKQREDRLSRAALETLSIIAYSQPLTRAEIESIRGVSAEGVIRALKLRNLVKEIGRKDSPGRPVLYGTTREFLKIFRLKSIADLPKLDELDAKRFAIDGRF